MSATGRRPARIVVIGAGIGGLSAAADLAADGFEVTIVERQAAPGGKMRELTVGDHRIDSGPTVFTMRRVFDALFAKAGRRLDDCLALVAAERIARHSWLDGSRLDLYADVERSAAAIEAFAGAREADAYRRFALESGRIFDTLDHSFMRRERPGPVELTFSMGLAGLPRMWATRPFRSLWKELGRIYRDPRLRQLFARYSTYCGSSPLSSPATLMLIAHAERQGVWYVEGGMQRLAEALATLAAEAGAEVLYGRDVTGISSDAGRATGVILDDGAMIEADAVVFNGDVAALAGGLLGEAAAGAVAARKGESRSLSAITWSLYADTAGFPLDHHMVFFGDDYVDEFEAIFRRGEITVRPTVYICAPDRSAGHSGAGKERLFLLVNAPPRPMDADTRASVQEHAFRHLAEHGLDLCQAASAAVVATPDDYARRFPGSEGAIYGWPTHGWSGTFRRPGSRSGLPGLYLAGGTVHPGPGVPMVALSGQIAAESIRQDLGASRP